MTLVDAGHRRYDLPLSTAWTTSAGATSLRSGYVFWLQDADGHIGWGDAAPLPGSHRAGLKSVERTLEQLAAYVRARRPEPTLDTPEGLDMHAAARHGWSQAVLGLRALRAQKPLHQVLARLSGGRPQGPAPATIPVNATLPIRSTPATIAAAKDAVEQGYSCLKLKVAARRDEILRVAEVRDAVGPKIRLRLDANGAWDEREAVRMLEAVAPSNIDYVEQPLPPGRPDALQRVHEASPVPIAADESAHNLAHALSIIEHGYVDVIIVKPMALGGLDRAVALCRLARAKRLRVVVTDSLDSAIGRTGAVHLAALLAPRLEPCGLASGERLLVDVVPQPPRVRRGRIPVPTKPGLGVAPPSSGGGGT